MFLTALKMSAFHRDYKIECDRDALLYIATFDQYVHILVFLPVLMFLSTLSLAPSHFSSLISPFLLILHLLVVCYIIYIPCYPSWRAKVFL